MQEVWLYGVIGEEGYGDVSAKDVRDELAKFDKSQPVVVRINSPGGSVYEGVSIRTMLSQWPGGVDVQVDGLSASAASYIGTIGRTVAMARDGSIMVHDAWTIAIGNSDDMKKASEHLEQTSETLVAAYVAKTGKSRAEIRRTMKAETWFTAEGAVEYGLADLIIGEDGRAVAMNTKQASRSVADLQARLDALNARLAASY